MHDSELFGGVLYTAKDVFAASLVLAELLKEPSTDPAIAAEAGLDPTLVDSLRLLGLLDPAAIDHACASGAAWVSGRRSVPTGHAWEAVASLPSHLALPDRLHRTTAETLVGLANGAKTRLRLAAPFMDEHGVGYLTDSFVAATLRHVTIELIRPSKGERALASIASLHRSIIDRGNPSRFRLLDTIERGLFPHLKVMTVDGGGGVRR